MLIKFYQLVRIVADDRKQQDLDLKPLFVANLRQAVILDSPNYLMAFWNCMSKDSGFSLIREKIDSLDQMWSRFDHVVVAAGSDTPRLWPTALPISLIGGSNIIYDSKELNIPFDFSAIMDGKYIVHQKHNHEVICGATHTYDIHRARSQGKMIHYNLQNIFVKLIIFYFEFSWRTDGNEKFIEAENASRGHIT